MSTATKATKSPPLEVDGTREKQIGRASCRERV